MKKKWYHAYMRDEISGEKYIVGVRAADPSEAKCRARLEAEKHWPRLWQTFIGFVTDLEAELSGLDEF